MSVTRADLMVKVNERKTTGSKTVVKLEMKNTFPENIDSARATVFLFDEHGKVVGQMARWVIGGTKDQPALAKDQKTTYHFVVPSDKPFTKTKVTFSRVILEGGKVADVNRSVQIQE